jgi:hypothetical protein
VVLSWIVSKIQTTPTDRRKSKQAEKQVIQSAKSNMKSSPFTFAIILLSLALISCENLDKKLEDKLNLINDKALKLDSLVNQELDKVESLDSIINQESEKVKVLDSLINNSSSRVDSLVNGKIDRINRILN